MSVTELRHFRLMSADQSMRTFVSRRRPVTWTNLHVAARMAAHHGTHVHLFIPRAGQQPQLITMPKAAVRALLHDLGLDELATCSFYVRQRGAYIVPLTTAVVLPRAGRRTR
jgi:hypothetical protein